MRRALPYVVLGTALTVGLLAVLFLWRPGNERGPDRSTHSGPTTSASTTHATGQPDGTHASSPGPPAAEDPLRNPAAPDSGKTRAVSGIVRSQSGEPVAATVTASPLHAEVQDVVLACSAQDGRFSMDLGVGTWSLCASAPGWMTASVTVDIVEGRTAQVEIVLQSGGTLQGLVTDPNGAPVQAATVSVTGPEVGYHVETATDAQGFYRLPVVPATYLLRAEHSGFAPGFGRVTIALGGDARSDLQLGRACRISGRVADKAGAPIRGANVDATYLDRTGVTSGDPYSQTVTANEDGTYVLSDLCKGMYILSARAEGYSEELKTQVKADSTDVDFVLSRGGRIEGRVVRKDDGRPVENPSVAWRPLSQGMSWQHSAAVIGAGGTFSIDGIPPGKLVVQARADGFATGQSPEIEVQAGQVVKDVVVELAPGTALRGVVLSAATRAPIAGAEIADLDDQGSMADPEGSCRTDERGRFEIPDMTPGTHPVRVSHEDYASVTRSVEIVEGKTIEEEFLLADGGRVFGKVLGPGGRPRARAELFAANTNGSPARAVHADEEGMYEIKGLGAGTYMVTLIEVDANDPTASKMNSRTVKVEEGKSVEVNFAATDGVRVWGTVRQGGRAMADANLQFLATSAGGTSVMARTDASGNYEAPGLRPGEYSVTVNRVMSKCIVPEGVRDVRQDFDLSTGGVSGHVYDMQSRAPLEGVSVMVFRAGAATGGVAELVERLVTSTRTDAAGAYAASGLAGGDYLLQVGKKGYAAEMRGPFTVAEDGNAGGKDFFLTEGTQVEGTVLDTRGRPVAGASFTLRERGTGTLALQEALLKARSDAQGRFRLPAVRAGEYVLAAHAEGKASAQQVLRVTPGQASQVEITLPAAGILRLRVRDASGAPVAEARLALYDAQGDLVESAVASEDFLTASRWRTGADGRFERGGLPTGHYRGEVAAGSLHGAFEVDVAEGQASDMDVTVQERR